MSTQDDDFARELQSHLEHEADDLIRDGVDPESARRRAHLALGNTTRARERSYERRRVLWLDYLWQDIKGGLRAMRRYPISAAVAILSLAFGIGATTVTLTVRNVLFRKPPPLYRDAGQLSRVQVGRPDNPIRPIGNAVPAPLFAIWQSRLGSSIAGSLGRPSREARVGDRLEVVAVRSVTPNLFPLLGVEPIIGQTIRDIRSPEAAQAAVLSYRVWQQLFDGRADAIGREFWLDNVPYVVTAVMPERFWHSEMNSPIWTLLDVDTLTGDDAVDVVVRRDERTTPAMLDAMLRPGIEEYARQLPATQRHLLLGLSGIEGTPLARQMSFALPYVLGVAVLLTLLIACANVAVLMIAQWTAREQEIAIRASIGASRSRIVRALLTESTTIAAIGGVLGIAAALALRAIILSSGGESRFYDLSIDPQVLVASAVITILTGIVAGIAPALYETRRLHANPLRSIAGSDRVRQRWRHALVVFEITVTIALLVQTTSLVNGYLRATNAAMGFATTPLLAARITNPGGVPIARIIEVARGLPGVESVSPSTAIPLGGSGERVRVAIAANGDGAVVTERGTIGPTFFPTLGVSLRAGRPFADGEPSTARTAIVNEALARRLFRGRDAVGSQVWIGNVSYDVIGLVADYANNPFHEPDASPRIFMPLPAHAPQRMTFLVRAADPNGLVQTLRRELRAAAVGNQVTYAYPLDEVRHVSGQEVLVGTAPLVPLIVIGVLLTTAGIYGVLAFAVARRSRELAVRVAIGASSHDLIRLVTMHTLRLVGTGLAIGIGLTFGLGRLVRASGGAGSMFDPTLAAFVVPIGVITVIAVFATWFPARRAASIDPVKMLRTT
jgi:putative ABC transport system permease protein